MAVNVDYVARETLHNLRRNFTLTLAALLTVVVSLTLVGISLLVRQATTNASGRFRGEIDLIVFMFPEASQPQIDAVAASLDKNPEVKSHIFIDKKHAYADFRKLFKDQPAMLESVSPSVLPTSFRVVPVNPDFQSIAALREVYQKQPGVKSVISADDTIKALQKVTTKIRTGVLLAAIFLLGAALLLIFNTIRTAMFARRREIEVMKLVGATNWFIRVPFILEGLIQGIVGGALAFVVLIFYNRFLTTQLASNESIQFFANFVVSTPDVVNSGICVLVLGAVVGAIASGLAVGRFLDV